MNKAAKDALWADAKKRCGLSSIEIQMAKELGMTPRSLTKNIPSKTQMWKAPVRDWVRELYEKKFGRKTPMVASAANAAAKPKPQQKVEPERPPVVDADLPF